MPVLICIQKTDAVWSETVLLLFSQTHAIVYDKVIVYYADILNSNCSVATRSYIFSENNIVILFRIVLIYYLFRNRSKNDDRRLFINNYLQ